jgi:ubiquinone/menaquinone biosynthesis C-methylase UbiE
MATDPLTIKSYNDHAHLWAGKMRSGKNYAHLFIEKPAMEKLLPNLQGKKILALGCGSGEEIELLRSKGAEDKNIIGIDISEKLIQIAKETYVDVDFQAMDMEKLSFENESFDLVYSSLALHYIDDWMQVLSEVYRVIKKSGQFVFSTHHPISWAAESISTSSDFIKGIGYKTSTQNRDEIKLIGTYLSKSSKETKWFNGQMKIKYFNKSLSEMFKEIQYAGFQITRFEEPRVLDEAKEKDFKFWKLHSEIPMFIVWDCKKTER